MKKNSSLNVSQEERYSWEPADFDKERMVLMIAKKTFVEEICREVFDNNHRSRFVSRKLLEIKTEIIEYPLIETSLEQISNVKAKHIPLFVYKENETYFCTPIPQDITFTSFTILGTHQCASCNHLSAASDEKGGCEKVRAKSRKIYNFKDIVCGYETSDTKCDVFCVVECKRYQVIPPRQVATAQAKTIQSLSMA